MQHFSENYWKKRLAKTVFLGEKGKWPENGRNGEKGKRNRMPGKGKRQSSRSEIGAQVDLGGFLKQLASEDDYRADAVKAVERRFRERFKATAGRSCVR